MMLMNQTPKPIGVRNSATEQRWSDNSANFTDKEFFVREIVPIPTKLKPTKTAESDQREPPRRNGRTPNAGPSSQISINAITTQLGTINQRL